MKTTGRKFKCIGLEGKLFGLWTRYFEVNSIHEEIEHGWLTKFGDNIIGNVINNNSIYLLSNNKTFWVDASQFELVEE